MECYAALRAAIQAEHPVASVTILAVPPESQLTVGSKLVVFADAPSVGSLGHADLDAQARAIALPMLDHAVNGVRTVVDPTCHGAELNLFVESFPPPPTLFMVGAVHIAAALTDLAKVLGFRTVVIDAREAFATPERFGHADELVIAWPDDALKGRLSPHSFVAVLTHDPKLDDPALHVALASSARYIGALGSPNTHAKRVERLREAGFSAEQIARIHGPIGLPLGAKTPEEIALSILAEIVKVKRGP